LQEFFSTEDLNWISYEAGFHCKLLQEIKALSEESSRGSPSFYVARVYAQRGEINTAFEWLEKAYQDHEVEMYWLKVEPPFKPLRNDPRWQDLLDKVGFPE